MAHDPKNPTAALQRAGDLLQSIFYAWREARLFWKVTSYHHEDSNLYVYSHKDTLLPEDGSASIFDDHPELHGPSADGKAILAFCGCDDPASLMYSLCDKIFEALRSDQVISHVQGIQMDIKPERKYVRSYYVDIDELDESNYRHKLYHVTLQDGREYALDLSAAQYGLIDKPVSPWLQYKNTFAATEAVSFDLAAFVEYTACDHRMQGMLAMALDMTNVIAAWTMGTGVSVADLLHIEDQKQFERLKSELVALIGPGIRGALRRRAETNTVARLRTADVL